MSTIGKTITCKAAICWAPKKPLTIETIEVAPPKAHEVRVHIINTAVCHTDANVIDGHDPSMSYPVILGHEGAGIVESVGEGVTYVKPGDAVIPLFTPQCKECKYCISGQTNLCLEFFGMQMKALLPDGTTRFSCKGKPVHVFMGCSTFSEYTVVSISSICKINSKAPLDKVCLIGCGISTGYGSAINTAQVRPGSSCAIWGLGGVGFAVAMGCKASGATKIIGIDINTSKFETAKQFGVTDCVNPKDHNKPITEVLSKMTDGGADYTFECVGNVHTMRQALESCHNGWGKAIQVGVGDAHLDVSTNPMQLILGKTWTGTVFGGWKPKDDIPKLVEKYMRKELIVDEFITHNMKISEINEAFRLMKNGECLRCVLHF